MSAAAACATSSAEEKRRKEIVTRVPVRIAAVLSPGSTPGPFQSITGRGVSWQDGPVIAIRPYRTSDLRRLHAIDQAAFEPSLAWSMAELRAYVCGRGVHTLVAEERGEA